MADSFNPLLGPGAVASGSRNPNLSPQLIALLTQLGRKAGPMADGLSRRATPPSTDVVRRLLQILANRPETPVAAPPPPPQEPQPRNLLESRGLLERLLKG